MSLDDVLGSAAEGLRESVAHLQPPAGGPPVRRAGRVVVAAIAAVAILSGGAYVLIRPGRTAAVRVSTRPGGLPRLVPDVVPPGLQLTVASDQNGTSTITLHTVLYGSGSPADPMAKGDVGVLTAYLASGQGSPGVTAASASLVNGHPADFQTVGGLRLLTWNISSDVEISVGSRTLPDPALLAIARGVVIDGKGTGRATRGLPSGDRLVNASVDSPVGPARALAGTAATGVSVAYSRPGSGSDQAGYLSVSTISGGPDQLVFDRWFSGGATDVTVRGHAAFLTSNAQGITNVFWQESPGTLVLVLGAGLTRGQVLASAASLRPVDDAAWQALQQEAQRNQATPQLQPGEEIVTSGSQQGVSFVLTVRDPGTPTQGFCAKGGQGTTCSAQAVQPTPTTTPQVLSVQTGSAPPFVYLHGNVAKSVARVVLQFADNKRQVVPIVAGANFNVFGAIVDRARMPTGVVALDANGRTVAVQQHLIFDN